ncbi:PqiC family protein [Roseateles sp. PN1]|uniref:PqiC family protein n=1 Tax=Roseateles sp. PN1 TaxID=3137372 RepID=UPI0031397A8A
MKPSPHHFAASAAALVGALLLSACASDAPPPRSVALQSLQAMPPATQVANSSASKASVVVDRVILPDLIRRNHLLERIAAGEVHYRDVARWAEPLSEAVPRVLADDLSALLGRSVTLSKLRPQASTSDPAWLLWLDVRSLEADGQGRVTLEAHWSWLREGKPEVRWQQGRFEASASSRDPERIAYAHSQVLQQLAQAMAAELARQP